MSKILINLQSDSITIPTKDLTSVKRIRGFFQTMADNAEQWYERFTTPPEKLEGATVTTIHNKEYNKSELSKFKPTKINLVKDNLNYTLEVLAREPLDDSGSTNGDGQQRQGGE